MNYGREKKIDWYFKVLKNVPAGFYAAKVMDVVEIWIYYNNKNEIA